MEGVMAPCLPSPLPPLAGVWRVSRLFRLAAWTVGWLDGVGWMASWLWADGWLIGSMWLTGWLVG